jgi:hypothetical protein
LTSGTDGMPYDSSIVLAAVIETWPVSNFTNG